MAPGVTSRAAYEWLLNAWKFEVFDASITMDRTSRFIGISDFYNPSTYCREVDVEADDIFDLVYGFRRVLRDKIFCLPPNFLIDGDSSIFIYSSSGYWCTEYQAIPSLSVLGAMNRCCVMYKKKTNSPFKGEFFLGYIDKNNLANTLSVGIGDKVPDELRRVVIKLVIEEGKSYLEASNILHIKIPTINRIVKIYRDNNTAVSGKKGGHKPASLNEEMKRKLVETINDDITIRIDGIIEKLHLSVHTTTIYRKAGDQGAGFIRKHVFKTCDISVLESDNNLDSDLIKFIHLWSSFGISQAQFDIYPYENVLNLFIESADESRNFRMGLERFGI
ncbi:hypothetical protein RF11_02427 [Thelohanellus kitauei]|uniref:Paired domain-containing protein n=1 Tax=Thelohanellus kitauei TaxID=669202 RepID=A0A0C2JCC7_THEKT|nr:hypothetical protein RF11_02427 [Thelohanellus kitauei]